MSPCYPYNRGELSLVSRPCVVGADFLVVRFFFFLYYVFYAFFFVGCLLLLFTPKNISRVFVFLFAFLGCHTNAVYE